MAKKRLKPALPKDEKEIFEKGFEGNICSGKKFITDGHSMFLADAAPKGMVFKKDDSVVKSPITDAKVQVTWDKAEKQGRVPASFIGCGIVGLDTVVAVLRDEEGRCAIFNPYILKFVMLATQADGFAFDPGHTYWFQMVVALREGKVVGAVMPTRYSEVDLYEYHLTGPAVPWSEV